MGRNFQLHQRFPLGVLGIFKDSVEDTIPITYVQSSVFASGVHVKLDQLLYKSSIVDHPQF